MDSLKSFPEANSSFGVFSLLLSGSGQYIDGFIITAWFDDATFAVFRYGARKFPLVIILLANAFSSSVLPGFANRSNLRNRLCLYDREIGTDGFCQENNRFQNKRVF
ncbi:MAG: hypothetical protein Q8N05_08375 [Bacteroidota bacterium]|nr:hypothetical protein [Bacteroidota bacterium]